jgi:hypothetical protein
MAADSARLKLEDFQEKMQYEMGGQVYTKGGKPEREKYGYWGSWTRWDDAQWQPHCLIFGAPLPEPIFHTIADYMCGTTGLWWDYTKVREGISISPTSRLHGDMLGKQSFQRKDAKEMMATIQTMKTVILNLESDLEKIAEQRNALLSGNPEQIKGLFVDNYGGPSRSWSALAHQVPIVRSALTWFYRLDEKTPDEMGIKKGKGKDGASISGESDEQFNSRWMKACQADMEKQAEEFVKKEELNPAVANYLKRKVQEYWNWRKEYKVFISRTFNSIIENLRQQRANLQLYLRWATRNIQEAEQLMIPYEEMKSQFGMFDEEFPQFAPLAYSVTEMFYDPEHKWPIVMDRLRPWIPCISIQLLMSYNPELQGNKFVRGFAIMTYGSMHTVTLNKMKKKLERQQNDFVELMRSYGGYSGDDLASLGLSETQQEKDAEEYKSKKKRHSELKAKKGLTDDEQKELKKISDLAQKVGLEEMDKGKSADEAKASAVDEFNNWFKPKGKEDDSFYYKAVDFRETFVNTIGPVLKFFGNEVPKTFDTRKRRSDWFAFNTFFRAYHAIKSNMGWMDYE